MGEKMHPQLHQEGEEDGVLRRGQLGVEWSRKEVSLWCQRNKADDSITEDEIREIWIMETPDD